MFEPKIDPKLDLVIEREIDVPPHLVWQAWTNPEYLKQWFCPQPWKVVEAELDVRPGGKFMIVMQSPEGVNMPNNTGCFLEAVENKRLTWTSALTQGFRPNPGLNNGAGMPFTAMIKIEAKGKGSKYTAIAMHQNLEDAQKHKEMGFYEGWGTTIDQLVALMKKKM